ncbi:MAG: dTDP-4-dehydrorhamnose reductase [Novosphingobium sp. 28-62-57]|uniref:dTDP-4-dehydrorhamnose reductase n=1 Tax=unclassified Novosphingobium TaxID=2644732 RepID=UPI000BD3F0CA|nr:MULTISPECIES: dTDP-4-dehydrorhamnose reductase [unclassified Novosphingobium]OYW47493.1 MAG: dTDP-4-dehydrorhamnose reductase [Novosphingobium sp. 12-63-9]OYZ23433.1 MAG: dTDP-4-dehydrorhamnose reductase [Novosphingobium sp. 16-62-11]OZA35814.1 MAG: dTDP-4-dehydrorhamnose reductase [Novosphingobium sp. 17-62-9]OYZ08153.1 MAG: dTDP-4-dehydrorhamnose reductase [Novosphingobium sp. 28-62-57]HQS68463.1 dTDP-4-dehydrorhamnose reductase [Novosphingobium sp.]
MKKALVTGVNGQLGKALLAARPAGWECVAVDRATLDLTDTDAIARMVDQAQPDLVLNAAAYTAVDRAESEPDLAMAVNAAAPGAFARALAGSAARLVQVSTDFVFDGTSGCGYRPDDARNPQSVYGQTKAAGEDAAGAGAIIVRTSWVHAAGGANFVRTMLRLMRERDELRVVADQIGSPTWAAGLAQTLWGLAAKNQPGIYHHRDAGVASWYDFAVAIAEEGHALGLLSRIPAITPIATADYPTPAKRPAFSVLDVSSTRTLLGDAHVHWRTHLKTMLTEESTLG